MFRTSAILVACLAGAMVASTSAYAGEITGPPPTVNDPAPGTSISNGNSRCSFSGLNDTPLGYAPQGDPGGIVQSYGYFMAQFGIFDPSDPDERAGFAFPGQGCNPTRTGGRH
jgi:hypothetical protein